MATVLEKQITLLAPEENSRAHLSVVSDLKIMASPQSRSIEKSKHLFVEISASRLPAIAEIIKVANESKYLRALFIREDVDAKLLPQLLHRAELRLTKNILVHGIEDWDIPVRVMRAWQMGSQNDLIATGTILRDDTQDKLCVITCALETIEISFDQLPILQKIKRNARLDFEIDEAGSFIHWPQPDIHIDIDVIRYATDKQWKEKADIEKLAHNRKFGQAIARLRQEHNLRQSDIGNLTDRQMRRIEAGQARPSVKTLNHLARAHNYSFQVYMERLGNILHT